MKKSFWALISFSCLMLTACAGVNINDAQSVKNAVSVETDTYQKIEWFSAPWFVPVQNTSVQMVFAVKNDIGASYTIAIRNWHNYGPSGFNRAFDSDGKRLPINVTFTDVHCDNGCTYEEDLSVSVDRAYMLSHVGSGIDMEIVGSGNQVQFVIPPGYVNGFMQVVTPMYAEADKIAEGHRKNQQ